jgi:hypothetical protein
MNLHYKGGRVKAEIALAKGKAEHDKRNATKDREWERERGRLMRHKCAAMHAPSTPPHRHALRVDVAVVLLFWGLVLVALALSRSLDLQRAGKAEGFLSSLAVMAPMMLPQVGFSLAGRRGCLHRHAHCAGCGRPRLLLACGRGQ